MLGDQWVWRIINRHRLWVQETAHWSSTLDRCVHLCLSLSLSLSLTLSLSLSLSLTLTLWLGCNNMAWTFTSNGSVISGMQGMSSQSDGSLFTLILSY